MPPTILEMRNLGPRCAEWLAGIGIHDENDLRAVGAAAAYRELVNRGIVRPHRMLLYALGGALLDMDCGKLPREIKRELQERRWGENWGDPVEQKLGRSHACIAPKPFSPNHRIPQFTPLPCRKPPRSSLPARQKG